jgi:L-asparaginase/Glu-tRNA(Gln) amidotransferase subunit D
MIALNNQINAARDATKTYTSSVETFKSGDFGLLGAVDAAALFRQSYGPPYGAIKLRNAAATAGSGRRIGGKT